MILIIALALTLTILYCIGVIVGSNIEKQRREEKRTRYRTVQQKPVTPPDIVPERHIYAEHQRMFNDEGTLVWEQKTLSKTPGTKNVDVFA